MPCANVYAFLSFSFPWIDNWLAFRHSLFMSKSALGRGLGALLGGISPASKAASADLVVKTITGETTTPSPFDREHVQRVAIGRIHPSTLQPRQEFPPDALKELSDSIREKGILQPLMVRRKEENFELIAGERRWRAAQMLGLAEVPILVREADDHETLELMLVENLQRENLNPIEEAQGYQQLLTQFQLRQEDIAVKVGKNRASVANALRLLKLPTEVQSWVRRGQLAAGHAKVILGLDRAEEQYQAAQKVLQEGLSVRATEELVARWQKQGLAGDRASRTVRATTPDAHVADLENRLQQRLGTKVQLRYRQGKGAVTIHFFNDHDLDRILEIMSVKVD